MVKQTTDAYTQALYQIVEFEGTVAEIPLDWIYALTNNLGRLYKNPRVLGKGGEAILIVALDPELSCDVAIKIALPVRVESKWDKLLKKVISEKKTRYEQVQEMVLRFTRGIGLQRQLHDLVVAQQLIGMGKVPRVYRQEQSPRLHYVMEYVPSQILMDYCKEQSTDEAIIHLFIRLANFVYRAFHAHDIIHTDLKPENILVSGGIPVIVDFGIAKDVKNGEQITDIHTKSLASPKWATAKQRHYPKYRSFYEDIFQLGLVFWAMWTREIPPLLVEREKVKTHELFNPAALPREFQQFFLRCTDETGSTRYQHITEMLEGFNECSTNYLRGTQTTIVENQYFSHSSALKIDWHEAKDLLVHSGYGEAIYYFLKGLEALWKNENENQD